MDIFEHSRIIHLKYFEKIQYDVYFIIKTKVKKISFNRQMRCAYALFKAEVFAAADTNIKQIKSRKILSINVFVYLSLCRSEWVTSFGNKSKKRVN